jgi:hypothetical protein
MTACPYYSKLNFYPGSLTVGRLVARTRSVSAGLDQSFHQAPPARSNAATDPRARETLRKTFMMNHLLAESANRHMV